MFSSREVLDISKSVRQGRHHAIEGENDQNTSDFRINNSNGENNDNMSNTYNTNNKNKIYNNHNIIIIKTKSC